MKIIIAGAGKIGCSVASILSDEGHDITVIDNNPAVINNLSNNLDVICVEGSAANPETLTEAGAADADLIMAAMRSDEMNMVCGISARKLGTKHVIARIRDTGYMKQTEFLREALGLSVIVNPELECAKEISRILRFPSAIRVDAFSKGSAEIIEHRILPDSKLDGMQLKDMVGSFSAKVLVGVVERGGEAIIPNGNFTLKAGDLISVTGASQELRKFFVAAGQYRKRVKNTMIMGGGRIAVHLTRLLMESGIAVTIVEADRTRCEELCDLVPGARIICGDATRGDILLEEGIKSSDAFVALTGDDGDNIITSIYAKQSGVGKIVVKVNREYYSDILESSGHRLRRDAQDPDKPAACPVRARDEQLRRQQHGNALPPCRRQGRSAGVQGGGGLGLRRHPAENAASQAEHNHKRSRARQQHHHPRRRNRDKTRRSRCHRHARRPPQGA